MGKADPTPFGILLVFLVLPKGERILIRSPVGDLKRCIAYECHRAVISMRAPRNDLFVFCLLAKIAVLEPLGPESF